MIHKRKETSEVSPEMTRSVKDTLRMDQGGHLCEEHRHSQS